MIYFQLYLIMMFVAFITIICINTIDHKFYIEEEYPPVFVMMIGWPISIWSLIMHLIHVIVERNNNL